jgi:two-component system, OmpR family, sensor histidine kinase BaeS
VRLRGGIAARIAAASLLAVAVAVAIVATGVLTVGQASFTSLMAEHGTSAASARTMFDESVRNVLMVAIAVGVSTAVACGVYLAGRISRPIDLVGAAARRLAQGELGTRVPRTGPAELRSLADSFNQLSEELERQERHRVELIENFAHELRTPLTNLVGYLHALRDGVLVAGPEVFGSLVEEVERLQRLSLSLDVLAESDPGAARSRRQALDLSAAICSAVELAGPVFERSGVRVEVDVPVRLRAAAVPDHLSQVLGNLLQNAQRYTPAGGTVTVSARREPDSVLVSVVNTGVEVPAGELDRVFERFYRVDRSRDRATGGAGIGLAIVKQLVERAGGRVGAESAGGSTRFWFSLPAA